MIPDSDTYFKLVITGSVNSGKTTFVRTLSEIEPITTDEWATDEVKDVKSHTTVAMDYGKRTISDDIVLHLYGTPGQERFYFMWDVLVEGAFGVIFLADSTDIDSIQNTKRIIAYFLERHKLPFLLCVTKLDCAGALTYEEVLHQIDLPELPAVSCKTIDKEDVRTAVITLLTLAIDQTV